MAVASPDGRPHLDQTLDTLDGPGAVYIGCTITGLAGQRVDLRDQTFEDCRFVACSLPLALVAGARFIATGMQSCDLMGVDWTSAGSGAFGLVDPLRFADCRLDYAGFARLKLDGVVLYGCSLVEADLEGAVLTGADLRHADLSGARLGGADLRGADLTGAIGYAVDPGSTMISDTRVSVPEALSVLEHLGFVIEAGRDRGCRPRTSSTPCGDHVAPRCKRFQRSRYQRNRTLQAVTWRARSASSARLQLHENACNVVSVW